MDRFDLVVIGSGPGGYRAAVLAALHRLKVAIIEKRQLGGCCLNRGCVPKKAWYHSACTIAASSGYAARGIQGALQGDFSAAWRYQHKMVGEVRAGYADYLRRLGVTLIEGEARLGGTQRVFAGNRDIAAGHVIVATGSAPHVPAGLAHCPGRVLSTDDLFDKVPPAGRRVGVVGSGLIGTEFAFILSALGLEVVWLTGHEALSHSRFSVPARRALVAALAQAGVRPRAGSRAVRAHADGPGVLLELADGRQEHVDWVLCGAGRVPHTAGLELAAAGVATSATGFVEVDERLRTSARGVYAVGDVANPAMTSNHALADAAVAVDDIVTPASRSRDNDAVPQVVYSALELARIGIDEETAESRDREVATGFTAFETSPAAHAEGDARGFVRILSDMDTGALLGAEIAGAHAGELVHLLGLEFGSADALKRLASVAYNHPARAEEILNATETLVARWGLAQAVRR